jgi:transposase InsO family protein
VRFAFIETEKACFPITLMCRVLAVSRAGFYAWRQRPAAARTRADKVLAVAVAAIYAEHHGRYGSPRVRMELRGRGQRSGRKRIARLMRLQGLRARPRRRYRTTTDSPPRPAGLSQPAGAAVRRGPTQHRLGDRHDLSVDCARLALSGGDDRPVLASGGGLVDERAD